MLRKILPAGDLFRNISTLVTGTFLAQLVPMLLQAVLRRIYPEEDFGAFAVYISVVSIVMIIASLRYEIAVVLPAKKSDAVNLAFVSMFSAIIFNILFLIAIAVFHSRIMGFLNLQPQYGFVLYMMPLGVLLFSLYQVINYYLVRFKDYKAVSINKISRRLGEGLFQTTLGTIGKHSSGLIWGNLAGHLVNLASGWWQMLRHGFSFRLFSWKRQWKLMKQYREFPFYNMIPAFLGAICMHFPVILVSKFYTQEITAYFDLTRMVLVLPASILSLSISQVLLQSLSEKFRNKESIRSDLSRVMLLLSLLAGGMLLTMLLWAPPLFSLYAGPSYSTSGVYARILVAGAALKLVASPVSSLFVSLGRIKMVSIWQAVYFLLICCLFFFRHLTIEQFLYIYLGIDLLAYGVLLLMILHISRNYEKDIQNHTPSRT
ncbi:MAG: lipopolysaccharide biosynthesis protein [Bacteroidales bacterium]